MGSLINGLTNVVKVVLTPYFNYLSQMLTMNIPIPLLS